MARSQAVLSHLQQARGRRGHRSTMAGGHWGAPATPRMPAPTTPQKAVTGRQWGAPSWGGSRERCSETSAAAQSLFPQMQMEFWCEPPAGRRGPSLPRTSTLALALASAGLLLLLLRPLGEACPTPPPTPPIWPPLLILSPSTGCLGAGDALGALSTDVPAGLDALCAPSATCPSGRRHLPRQVTGGSQPLSTAQYAASKTPDSDFFPREYCGLHVGGGAQGALRTLRDREEAAGRVRDLPFTSAY